MFVNLGNGTYLFKCNYSLCLKSPNTSTLALGYQKHVPKCYNYIIDNQINFLIFIKYSLYNFVRGIKHEVRIVMKEEWVLLPS